MMRITVGMKISLGFFVILLMVIFLGGNAYLSLRSIQGNTEAIFWANRNKDLQSHIINDYLSAVLAVRGFVSYGDEKFCQQAEEHIFGSLEKQKQLLEIVPPDRKEDVEELIRVTNQYRSLLLVELFPVVRAQQEQLQKGDIEQAKKLKEDTFAIAKKMIPLTEHITKKLETYSAENEQIAEANIASTQEKVTFYVTLAFISTALTTILGVVLAFIFTRMIYKPITRMVSGARRLAGGDLRQSMDILGQDEFAELARAFNEMQSALKNVINDIKSSSTRLNESSLQLSMAADQSARASKQVSESMVTVSQGAEDQLHSVNDASTVVDYISAGMQQIANHVGEVSSLSNQMANLAQEGGKAVNAAISQIGSLEKTVTHSAQVVSHLGQRSKEISQIVDLISGIAEQTNLLALNAAIEAAHAGIMDVVLLS
ncbi:HAMP domain-containing protein [Heliobacillus mobilis]|uniref:HAMP domain-containing protein n=1 Tax=Heliobacterium mobile TaxID=28064 RepID=A0A6I3SH94_HELMO|nr:methyl-accepting chemotaxis protein [Heliobacterium mobile]MTV48221.1 HAMP domain-containing protein [Heliobacterium mobile]